MATALMDELMEEVLFRLPPDDPALLIRAALVCKRWCRLVSAPAYRRRLRDFHRAAAPVLGVLRNIGVHDHGPDFQDVACFVSTSSFRPRGALRSRGWRVLDARHGRVLLRSPSHRNANNHALIVWDPVTGREQELPPAPWCSHIWNGAVLCGGDCNHLNCRNGPFLVVVVGSKSGYRRTFVVVYSSEANAWSDEATETVIRIDWFQPSVLVENALYFLPQSQTEIVEYNLGTREISEIQLPSTFDGPKGNLLIMTMDGQLGFAIVHNSKVYQWVREVGPKGDAGWAQTRTVKLEKLLPARLKGASAVGFLDGANLIFVETQDGLFAIDLKSQLARKVCEGRTWDMVIPYVTFYTPGTVLPCF
ncbi:unnamed protein product [Urochloa humidicola]